MYRLRQRRTRFSQISQASVDLYDFSERSHIKKYIFATGVLNQIWQSWNYFWRSYWLAYVIGGKDLQNHRIISPIYPYYRESQALYYLLTLLGKRKANSQGSIIGSYQEATWGDFIVLQNLASQLSSHHTDIARVLSAFTLFGDSVQHFQIVRNAQVHISTSNMDKIIHTVVPSYVISSKIKYPHEILEARKLRSARPAINDWIYDMDQFLQEL